MLRIGAEIFLETSCSSDLYVQKNYDNKQIFILGSIAFLIPCRDMNLPEIDKDKMDVFYILLVNVVLINF